METVYVYNNETNAVERYRLTDTDAMPYIENRTMTVREFRARSCSPVLWTDIRAMRAWNSLRRAYGRPIPIGAAFRRIWEGRHSPQSQHYAGIAFDVGQTLTQAERNEIFRIASRSAEWTYVDPLYRTPTWVHMDTRFGIPACSTGGGYPTIRQGDRGVYVFVAQDALAALGFPPGGHGHGHGLDGIFGPDTRAASMAFQYVNGLIPDAVIGCATWSALTAAAAGLGQTVTVIGKCHDAG